MTTEQTLVEGWKKIRIKHVIALMVSLVLWATNPSKEDHQRDIIAYCNETHPWASFFFGVDKLSAGMMRYRTLLIFSWTSCEECPITVGVLGNVVVVPAFKKYLEKSL